MKLPALIMELSRIGVQLWEENGKLCYSASDPDRFTEALKSRIRDHKTEILALLGRTGVASAAQIPVATLSGPGPTSVEQQRFLMLDRLFDAGAAYNLTSAFLMKGQLQVDALRSAALGIVQRHEILRTYFFRHEGEFRQAIAEERDAILGNFSNLEMPHGDPRKGTIEAGIQPRRRHQL